MSDIKKPRILEDLTRIKSNIQGTDREDQLEELNDREKRAKEALVKLSLLEIEGIKLLRDEAQQNLEGIYIELLKKPTVFNPEYSNRQSQLFQAKDMWEWFLSFFTTAESAKKDAEIFIKEQLNIKPDVTNEDTY